MGIVGFVILFLIGRLSERCETWHRVRVDTGVVSDNVVLSHQRDCAGCSSSYQWHDMNCW